MDTIVAEGINYDGVVCPKARKCCKEKKKKLNEENSIVDTLNNLQSNLENQNNVHREELELIDAEPQD